MSESLERFRYHSSVTLHHCRERKSEVANSRKVDSTFLWQILISTHTHTDTQTDTHIDTKARTYTRAMTKQHLAGVLALK